MSLDELQAELSQRGCVLWVEGEMLRFRAPDGALDPPLMRELKRSKKALIQRLKASSSASGRTSKTQQPSFGQQAMWMLHAANRESPAYNVASAAEIHAPLDVEALTRVWRTLVSRHDSLRTTFETRGGGLVAKVHELAPQNVELIDAAGQDDATLAAAVRQAYRRPFDLTKGPLARLQVFQRSDQRFVLLLSLHHIVFDAWSLWMLLDEIGQLYAKESQGEVGTLPAPETTYGEFVQWQQEMPNTQQGREQWEYWKQQLADNPPPARLPWDRPRPARAEQQGATHRFPLPPDVAAGMRELGKQHGATPFVVLQAVFNALLYRHSGQRDFLIGTTTSGRSHKCFSRLVGYLVNTLPLRCRVTPEMSFAELLEQTRETTLGAMAAQDFPFPLLVERLNPPRRAGALPLCRIMFGLQKPQGFGEALQALDVSEDANAAPPTFEWGGLPTTAFPLDQQEGQFDLTLEMYETASTFAGVLKYDTNLLDAESARLVAERYVSLARQVVQNADLDLDQYDLISTAERELVGQFAAGDALPDEQPPQRLERRFAQQAEQMPDAVAIICDEDQLTYAQADARSNQIAHWLTERGAQAGDKLGCCTTRGFNAWLLHLACLKVGAVYVPLDEGGPPSRTCQLLRDCGATLLITDSVVAKRQGLATADLSVRMELLDESADEIAACSTKPIDNQATADEPAYVIYTSGSTGQPKGVVVSHRAFAHHLARIVPAFGLTGSDRVLQFCALTFDPSLEQAWATWATGATLVLRGTRLWSASEFWSRVKQHGITVANIPPAYFREVSESRSESSSDALRLVIVGGDAFPTASLSSWRESGVQILNAYGPTEAVVTATVCDLSHMPASRSKPPIGKPLGGTRAFVIDKHDRPQPVGIVGELLLAGPALAEGYLNDGALTEQRFAPLPKLTGTKEPVYRTGDLVRLTHRGELEFVGRIDRQVKINGYRIELGELERCLEALPGVTAAVAKVWSRPSGESHLAAYYTQEDAPETVDSSARALLSTLRAKLPHYLVPASLQPLEALPLNCSGKVDSKQLPEPPSQPVSASTEYVAPTSEVEKILCEVWTEVLGAKRVGIHDDFFELGGASLKSLQIVAAAEARGLTCASLQGDAEELSPALMFEYPTVSQLAGLLVLRSEKQPAADGSEVATNS